MTYTIIRRIIIMPKLIKLENLRKQNGLSHQALANAVQDYLRKKLLDNGKSITSLDLKKASYKRTTYTMLENGYVKTVSDDVIEALAYVLHTDFDTVKDACTLVVDNREREELIDDINIILSYMTEEQLTALLNMLSSFKRQ